MGSSGAGKTTLLDVLAGRKTGGTISGDIRLNGHLKMQKTFTRYTRWHKILKCPVIRVCIFMLLHDNNSGRYLSTYVPCLRGRGEYRKALRYVGAIGGLLYYYCSKNPYIPQIFF